MRQMKMISTCLIPLFIGGRLVGAITTSASHLIEFQAQDIGVLRGIGDLVTVTLEKLQLIDETRQRAEQLAAAAEIGRAATASFDLTSVLETTVNLIRDRFGFYHASIFIIPPGSNMAELRESTGEAGQQLKARRHKLAVGSKSLVGAATATRKPVVVQEVRADPTYYPNPLLPDTRAEAVIPLIAGDTVVGAVDVQSTLRGIFGEGDIAVLVTIAGQLAVAVQNARLYEQTARWASREQLASQITNKIRAASAGDIDGMLRTAVTELRQALGTSHGAVQLLPGRAAQTLTEAPPGAEREG
jgi:GAF domain-containing protein